MGSVKENQIIDVDGYVHIVNKKVICFKPDVFDLNNPEDIAHLIRISDEMFTTKIYPAIYGEDNTGIIVCNFSDGVSENGASGFISLCCIEDFPDERKRKVRCILSEFEKV